MKEMAGQEKSTEKQTQQKKHQTVQVPSAALHKKEGKPKIQSQGKPERALEIGWQI
jgi:hypothetical protein